MNAFSSIAERCKDELIMEQNFSMRCSMYGDLLIINKRVENN